MLCSNSLVQKYHRQINSFFRMHAHTKTNSSHFIHLWLDLLVWLFQVRISNNTIHLALLSLLKINFSAFYYCICTMQNIDSLDLRLLLTVNSTFIHLVMLARLKNENEFLSLLFYFARKKYAQKTCSYIQANAVIIVKVPKHAWFNLASIWVVLSLF